MTHHTVIAVAFFLIYYNIGGLSTTNILRLTKGNNLSVNSSKCVCDGCGTKISTLLQLPIISYVICKGKCRNCGCGIPVYPLLMEILILSGMFIISLSLSFSALGVVLSFLFYELMRIVVIAIRGRRESQFLKQYIIAVISMVFFLAVCLFVSALYSVV